MARALRDTARSVGLASFEHVAVDSVRRTIERWESPAYDTVPGDQYELALAHLFGRTPSGTIALGPGSDFQAYLSILEEFGAAPQRLRELTALVAEITTTAVAGQRDGHTSQSRARARDLGENPTPACSGGGVSDRSFHLADRDQEQARVANSSTQNTQPGRDATLADARTRADRLRHAGTGQAASLVPGVFGSVGLDLELGEFLRHISVQTPVPARIEWSDVEHVRSTTRAVATAENVFGGGLSCEAATAQLRWAGKLLDARANDDVRRAMFEAIGNLSSVVAYSAFDISAHAAADRCFHFALWCADQSGSWALRANTLAEMSRKAAYLGDLDDALSMIEFAQVRSDRVANTARAMLHTLRARLLALTNRYAEARSDIAQADVCFHDGVGDCNPPWLTYYDKAEHQGSIGKALIPLAHAERNPEIAASRLRDAVALHRDSYPRSRVFSRTRLATLVMHIGDPNEAVAIGRQALTEAASLRSDRIARELRGLAQASTMHAQISDVNDLRHDLLELTPAKAQ